VLWDGKNIIKLGFPTIEAYENTENNLFIYIKEIMKLKTWNWGAFLLCPIWSIFHRMYFGLYSIFIPILFGLLFMLVILTTKIPMVGEICFGFTMATYFLYLVFSSLLGLGELSNSKIVIDSGIGIDLLSVMSYLAWSAYIGVVSDKWLLANKSREELLIINNNAKKWNAIGAILFVPLTLAIGYSTAWLIYQITLLIFC
jgi:hypothetical protein